jgi:hypothetical protein
MTVENQTNKKRFQGDGVTDTVTFSFRVISASDIKIYVYPRDLDFTDIELYLLSTSYYTVTIDADGEGGEVVFLAGHIPTNTEDALIINALDLTQTADLPTEGNFNEEAVETALDRVVMQNIQQQEKINRGVFLSPADPLATEDFTGIEIVPDLAVNRALKVVQFTSDGLGLQAGPDATDIAGAQGYAAAALVSQTAAEAAAVTAQGWSDTAQAAAVGINWTKVRAFTTGALPSCTYNNGASGVGATLTATANGALAAQDGVTLVLNDRLCVKDQAATLQNGIYRVTQVGSGGTPWILTRVTDADTWAELVSKVAIAEEGSTLAEQAYICISNTGGTIGVSAVTWSTFTPPLADGAVSTAAKIVDGIITYVKMAASAIATSAEIIAGTANKLVNAAQFKAGLRGLESYTLLSTQTLSGVASANFTSLITSEFDEYVFEFIGLQPVTNSVMLYSRMSVDNGATWINSASAYAYAVIGTTSGATTVANIGASATEMLLSCNVTVGGLIGNGAAQGCNGNIKLYDPMSTIKYKTIVGQITHSRDNNEQSFANPSGRLSNNTQAVNAIQFFFSSGNIAAGIIRMYGVRKV